jgi:hypothetical protein
MSKDINSLRPADFFVNETEKKEKLINIQLVISDENDVDDVISKLMKSLYDSSNIIEGASVQQIYFKGTDINNLLTNLKNELKENLINAIDNVKV